jgi:ATP synthase protein I
MAKLEDGTDDSDLKARLEKLSTSLDAHQRGSLRATAASESEGDGSGSRGRAMSAGARVLSEFVAGILVGGFIGWELDNWLGTGPGFFVFFLMLGLAAGFWNVYRIAKASDESTPAGGAGPGKGVPPVGGA